MKSLIYGATATLGCSIRPLEEELTVVEYLRKEEDGMYLFNNNGKDEAFYEVYDKDYSVMIIKTNGNISKYPTIMQYVSTIKSYDENNQCLPTGIAELDNTLGGGLTAGLYIFGANPGLGKTSLVLHLLINLALNQHHSLFFNLEMSPFQIMAKLLSNYSYRNSLLDENQPKMSINELSSKSLYDEKTKSFTKTSRKIIKSYDDTVNQFITIINRSESKDCDYVECIEQALKNYKRHHKIIPVIVIDFLQLLKLTPVYDDRNFTNKEYDKRLEVNEIIEKLKKYSNVYKTPIILISSLSRSAYTKTVSDDDETEYSLSIFKETGHIEYTADFLALLTKGQTKTSFSEEDKTVININVLKTRYSKYTGEKISLGFIPEYSYFEELDQQ